MKFLALTPRFARFLFLLFSVCTLLCAPACKSERLLDPDQNGARGAKTAATTAKALGAAPVPGKKIQFVKAGAGDVAPLVKSEKEAAAKDQRGFLVYVGATWCEPCQRFHDAAAHGELDADLPQLTLLEFDADNDSTRLRQAGYGSTYIPHFAVPNADGRASGRFIEGGIKGQGAARELVPRLTKLLAP